MAAGYIYKDGEFLPVNGTDVYDDAALVKRVETLEASDVAQDEAIAGKLSTSGTAAAAAKLATARAIDGVSFNGTANIVHYGTCGTAAATAAKTVSCTGFTLVTGAWIAVRFTTTNTTASPTLNVNSTGAKAIQYRNAAIPAGYLAANRTYLFVYDGASYELVGDVDTQVGAGTGLTKSGNNIALASDFVKRVETLEASDVAQDSVIADLEAASTGYINRVGKYYPAADETSEADMLEGSVIVGGDRVGISAETFVYIIQVFYSSAGNTRNRMQLAVGYGTGNVYTRVYYGQSGGWTEWKQLAFDADVDTLRNTVNGLRLAPGTVIAFAANKTPAGGYLLCNGSKVSRTTYATLFAAIGTTYGTGDGSTTFTLPNLANRFIMGHGTAGTVKAAGLPNILGEMNSMLGYTSGIETSGALYHAEIASAALNVDAITGGTGNNIAFNASRSNAIYGNSTTVQPPALTMRYYIKY